MTNLTVWSSAPAVLVPNDGHVSSDGSINGMKRMWWRFESGTLSVEGHRLDADEAPLIAGIPKGDGPVVLQPVWLPSPSAGCRETTGQLGEYELILVTYVVPPFPIAAASPES